MWSNNGKSSTGPDDVPMIHCHSTPSLDASLAATSSATDSTSCNLFLSELSSTEIENPSSATRLLQQPHSNSETGQWTSAAAVFERGDNAIAERELTDGYFTAHASMVSLTPENVENKEVIIKPRNFGDAVFINIGPSALLASTHSDNSPTPSSQSGDVCRICHGEGTADAPLISPCSCAGSMKYVHQECIQTWLKSSHSVSCELCRFTYLTGTKVKPVRQWKPLELTLLERWKIVCCVMIQLFAICYFVLSVEALVRAAKDFHVPQAAMWLWIKIIMSVFGVSVSLACTVRQCKTFARLFRRLEIHNRTIYVKDRTESIDGTSAVRTLLGGPK